MLVVVGAMVLLTGCDRFTSDSATRIAYQLRDELAAFRKSGATSRTFEHRPLAAKEQDDREKSLEGALVVTTSVILAAKKRRRGT
jgi:hypothetical protein